MFKILNKRELAPGIFLMDVEAPRIAKSALPGQFLIVRVDECGERIPLTICDYDVEHGTVTIVTQVVGSSTNVICSKEVGDGFIDVAGPLGNPSELIADFGDDIKSKNVLFVAGGVGAAPVYPQVKWLAEHGMKCDVLIGGRSKEFVLLQEEFRRITKHVYIATDDGSLGFAGNVAACLTDLVQNQGKKYDLVVAIGPMIMMKFVAIATKQFGIKTVVSLNTLMVDGTGMCGACRVSVGGKTRFTCVDGPEFDGHEVDFDEAMRRQLMYKTLEMRYKAEQDCKCTK